MMKYDEIEKEWFDHENESSRSFGLIQSCKKAYSWELEWTLRVLKGYRQFLHLQRNVLQLADSRDDDSVVYSPIASESICQMWGKHASHPPTYRSDCRELVGAFLPFEVIQDPRSVIQRRSQTRQVLEIIFKDEVDRQVWNNIYPDAEDDLIEMCFYFRDGNFNFDAGSNGSDSILTMHVFRDVPLEMVFRHLALRMVTSMSRLTFTDPASGKPLLGAATADAMGWRKQQSILVTVKRIPRYSLTPHHDMELVEQCEFH